MLLHNIPLFPEFRPINLTDREWYNNFFQRFPPYADFSFGNFMIWHNQYNDLHVSTLHNNFIIRCTSLFMNGKQMLSLIGNQHISETIETMLAYQEDQGLEPILLGVPESVIQLLEPSPNIKIVEESQDHEYMLDTHKVSRLEGSEYRKQRREVSIVGRTWGNNAQYAKLDLTDKTNTAMLRANLHQWEKAFSTNETAYQEAAVLETTLSLASSLEYKNLSIFVNGELCGFTLYQPLPQPNCVVLNHIKTNYKYRFASDILLIEQARSLAEEGIETINFEQDLGIAGLREHKQSFHPVTYLRKFTVLRP